MPGELLQWVRGPGRLHGQDPNQPAWALQVAALSLSSEALGLLQGLSGWFHHWVPCFPCLSKMDRTAPTS